MPAIVPFLPYIAAGASFLGGMVKNKSQQTSTTTPTLNPAYSPLQAQILAMVKQRLSSDPDLTGYRAGGEQNINRIYGNTAVSQGNDLTTRGLSTSPVAATVAATRENARAGTLASFVNQLPLLKRQMQAEDLGIGTNVLQFGRGSTTTGTATGGGGLGGGIENLAQYLGYLSGKGAFGKQPGMYASPAGSFAPSDTAGWG